MLELRNILLSHPGKMLFGIDQLSLEAGFHLLVGANGAGKSTFLQSLITSSSPGMKLDGTELNALSASERSKRAAFVSSSFTGLDYMKLREYLDLGRYPHTGKSGRLSEDDAEIVNRYASLFRLQPLLERFTASLSDGERQRASIARAFIQQSAVILLDEPTSFLDYPFKQEILSELQTAATRECKVIVASTHDLEIAGKYASSFLVIDPVSKKLVQLESTVSFTTLLAIAFPKFVL